MLHTTLLVRKLAYQWKVCAASDYSTTQMPTKEMLHKVPCVQFSFSNDSTILSESVESAMNVIADSVGSAFSTIII